MFDLSKYNQAIFDFDGVILHSNKIKSQAFAKSLLGEDENLIKKFIDYHNNNLNISRFDKFEHFFRYIKKQENYKKDLDRVLMRFSKLSYEGLLNCEEISGIRDILEFFYKNHIECFIVSQGEQTEVIKVLKKRKLVKYFKAVYGSPKSKSENFIKIKLLNSLYFGDSKSDYEISKF